MPVGEDISALSAIFGLKDDIDILLEATVLAEIVVIWKAIDPQKRIANIVRSTKLERSSYCGNIVHHN